jgi:hypothetical protein
VAADLVAQLGKLGLNVVLHRDFSENRVALALVQRHV